MKTLKNISVIGVLVTLFTVQAWAQMSGVMMVVKGDVKVTGKDGKTDAAKVGRKVASGDMITSGADSRAKIVMADKNVINISPDSKIMIEKYENDGKDKKNVELNVMYGKVRASVEQKYDGDKSKFNIKTPSAVAGVRGTDFMAGYSAQTKTTQVITFSGTVAVGKPGPGGVIQNPVFVQPGQMTQVGAGQAPEAPKSVPKEELNNANKETKAETASPSSDKKDSTPAADKSADKKEEAKKDEPKKEASTDKGSGDKKDRAPASENSGTAPAATAPVSESPGPAANSGGMKPDLPGQPNAGPVVTAPPMPTMIPTVFKPPVIPAPPADVIKTLQKARLSITVNPN